MSKSSKVGAAFADKYLGHEENIDIDVQDARYRYYQWLREWYGMGKKEDNNKCPFYQFMFWGSILMLVSIVPIILMKLIEVFILRPLSLAIPKFVSDVEAFINQSKMLSSWVITIALLIVSTVVTGLISTNVIAWIGAAIHYLFIFPVGIVIVAWFTLSWIFTVGIPWLFVGLVWVMSVIFTGIWSSILVLFGLSWWPFLVGLIWVVGILLASMAIAWLCYKIGISLFNSSFSKWLIEKSCEIREHQIEQKKTRKLRIKKAQQEKIEASFKWDEEHREEIETKRKLKLEKRAKKRESSEKWDEFYSKASSGLWKILLVFPGLPLIGIWIILKYIGIGFGHVFYSVFWVGLKFGDFFVIVWSLLTETVSNHCPPIDFTMEIDDTGILKKHSSEEFFFICNKEHKTLIIPNGFFPAEFKPTTSKKGRRTRISCTICTRELDDVLRGYGQYQHLRDVYNPVKVYKVNKLEYI